MLRGVNRTLQVFGKSQFFVSHAWAYKFSALVAMVLEHYAKLPETKGGARFIHVYYWLDIFAVTQVSKWPDGGFP